MFGELTDGAVGIGWSAQPMRMLSVMKATSVRARDMPLPSTGRVAASARRRVLETTRRTIRHASGRGLQHDWTRSSLLAHAPILVLWVGSRLRFDAVAQPENDGIGKLLGLS